MPPKPSDATTDPVEHAEAISRLIKDQFALAEGADLVLECTGAEPCIQAGINVAKKGGTVSFHGGELL